MNSNILSQGVLCSLKIYNWNAAVKIDPKKISSDAESEIIRAMQDIISDKSILKELRKIKNQAFYFLENKSLPFPLENAFFVPQDYVAELDTYLEDMKNKYFALVDVLLNSYDSLRKKFKIQYPRNYRIVKDKYPPIDRLRIKFRFEWNFYSITMPGEGLSAVSPEVFKKEKEKFNSLMAEMEDMTINLIRTRLSERIKVLESQCSGGTLNRATLNSINSVVEQWEEVWNGCVDNKRLASAIKSVKLAMHKVGDVDKFKSNEKLQTEMERRLGTIVKRLDRVPDSSQKRRINM